MHTDKVLQHRDHLQISYCPLIDLEVNINTTMLVIFLYNNIDK